VLVKIHQLYFMKRFAGGLNFLCGASMCFLLLSQFAFQNNANDHHSFQISANEWRAPALPQQLSFAGEQVPLDRWDVSENLDRELLINTYNQATILYMLKLSHRYFPVISERLKANGIPDDFKYMCIAESNLQSDAISRAGAVGFWQFMNSSAPVYGLDMNTQIDERMDIIKSTDAACRYIRSAYAKFGSWTAAAASYNCGQGCYNGQAVFQGNKNYYDLQLPEQTNRYVFRILAFKYILENAEMLGYKISDAEKYNEVPCRTITVSSSIPDLAKFAIDNGTTYKMIRVMNPWIRGSSLAVKKGSSYQIKLPVKN
jgi:membrane-bound lytic murein transglycosylase D